LMGCEREGVLKPELREEVECVSETGNGNLWSPEAEEWAGDGGRSEDRSLVALAALSSLT
jgi:hypothetical protein